VAHLHAQQATPSEAAATTTNGHSRPRGSWRSRRTDL
jgi:hypothetical protein